MKLKPTLDLLKQLLTLYNKYVIAIKVVNGH